MKKTITLTGPELLDEQQFMALYERKHEHYRDVMLAKHNLTVAENAEVLAFAETIRAERAMLASRSGQFEATYAVYHRAVNAWNLAMDAVTVANELVERLTD